MNMIEAKVNGLALDMTTNSPVVILSTSDSDRLLPIWIGHYEALAIAMELSGVTSRRPLTHDLLKSVIATMGGKVQKVEVTELKEQTFYAKIYVEMDGSILKIDARPSDSIALALKTKVPLYVAEELFQLKRPDKEGMDLSDPETLKERLKRINPEDFGKYSL
ncbi:MAG: bifunctional nuclease family protein [candidate division Zixibacteria bacterium]|nr:bifunctional nuclease family protein [candidate division Zixibacteria bacterium]